MNKFIIGPLSSGHIQKWFQNYECKENEKIFTVWLREYVNFRVTQNGHPIIQNIHKTIKLIL